MIVVKCCLLLVVCALSCSCHTLSTVTPPRTAHEITENYYKEVNNCGSENRPAFMCSGVMLRATTPWENAHSWDPSPASIASGGVSFSWLRDDSKFNRLAYGYNNGMIFYPHNQAPADKVQIEVLCSFPLDADTVNRSNQGCGANRFYPDSSMSCRTMGIRTADAWFQHYQSVSHNHGQHQCGFDTQESATENAHYFMESIRARSLLTSGSMSLHNELRLATWQAGNPKALPLQAFFYINDGLPGAQHDQRDYYDQTGEIIPIIRMKLPTSTSSDAKFNYRAGDQAVN